MNINIKKITSFIFIIFCYIISVVCLEGYLTAQNRVAFFLFVTSLFLGVVTTYNLFKSSNTSRRKLNVDKIVGVFVGMDMELAGRQTNKYIDKDLF